MPSSAAAVTARRAASAPRRCPAIRGMPRAFAQRPLPSMMIATCRGSARGMATALIDETLNLQDLHVLLGQRFVDAPDVVVGQVLDLLLLLALLVLRDLGLLLTPLDDLDTIAANVADRDAS